MDSSHTNPADLDTVEVFVRGEPAGPRSQHRCLDLLRAQPPQHVMLLHRGPGKDRTVPRDQVQYAQWAAAAARGRPVRSVVLFGGLVAHAGFSPRPCRRGGVISVADIRMTPVTRDFVRGHWR
jgi:hypothetical protein